jgi:hypothetical protein
MSSYELRLFDAARTTKLIYRFLTLDDNAALAVLSQVVPRSYARYEIWRDTDLLEAGPHKAT